MTCYMLNFTHKKKEKLSICEAFKVIFPGVFPRRKGLRVLIMVLKEKLLLQVKENQKCGF